MNVDYLSREFLRQTGQKFTDYLTKLRITKKQKPFLKNASYENLCSCRASRLFQQPSVFCSNFLKAATGQTPKAWAKMQQVSGKKHNCLSFSNVICFTQNFDISEVRFSFMKTVQIRNITIGEAVENLCSCCRTDGRRHSPGSRQACFSSCRYCGMAG